MSSPSTTKGFVDSTFPSLKTIILGFEESQRSNEFLEHFTDYSSTGDGSQSKDEKQKWNTNATPAVWRLDRDIIVSLRGAGNGRDGILSGIDSSQQNAKKRLVLLVR
mmetsp:Transcript_27353/g.58521  ORF Transcript_27353/g.58521 Transcript_27353/m.58521 type:complete len:107 (-) Transcript_27353:129-449(-)